jgi:geranylgeranyl pyrophosphate synthase
LFLIKISHDDIEDGSDKRRGIPAAHKVFGVPLSLNAGTYAMISPLDKILKEFPQEKKVEASKIYCETILKAHIGQGLDSVEKFYK